MRKLPIVASRSAVHEDLPRVPDAFAQSGLPPLVDARGREYTYLRLSVTDRCDLACVYCMPPGGELDHGLRRDLLSFEEAARLVDVMARLGIRRVRFTGGEPLVRRDVVDLVSLVHRTTAVKKLVMTTNATRLAELARPLRDAGLSGVNVSVDSLDPETFRRVTRGGDLVQVLEGIRSALDVGLEVKINTVLLRGETDHEAERLVRWAFDLGMTPRFIELMPLGEGANLPPSMRVPANEVVERLGSLLLRDAPTRVVENGPARYLESSDGSGRRVGFITPLSDEFCGSCNRVRITARGDVRACLASRKAISLRDLMRADCDDRTLAWALHWSLASKAQGHFFLDQQIDEHTHVGMSLIGG